MELSPLATGGCYFLRRFAASPELLNTHGLRRGLHSCAALRLPYPTVRKRDGESSPRRRRKVSLWRAVAGAAQHADVGTPGTDRRTVLVGHHTRYLVEMSKVVDCPGGE